MFKEKPKNSMGIINGGFMVFNNGFLDYLTTDENCDLEWGALENLSAKGEVMVYKHEGLWECIDTERDLFHLNNFGNSNKAFWKLW